jgi:hypothetical protein
LPGRTTPATTDIRPIQTLPGRTLKKAQEGPERQIILDVLQANDWTRNVTAGKLCVNSSAGALLSGKLVSGRLLAVARGLMRSTTCARRKEMSGETWISKVVRMIAGGFIFAVGLTTHAAEFDRWQFAHVKQAFLQPSRVRAVT